MAKNSCCSAKWERKPAFNGQRAQRTCAQAYHGGRSAEPVLRRAVRHATVERAKEEPRGRAIFRSSVGRTQQASVCRVARARVAWGSRGCRDDAHGVVGCERCVGLCSSCAKNLSFLSLQGKNSIADKAFDSDMCRGCGPGDHCQEGQALAIASRPSFSSVSRDFLF